MKLKSKLLSLVGATALTVIGIEGLAKKTNLFDSHIDAIVLREGKPTTIEVPVYNKLKLPSLNCSGYVRRVAEDKFGLEYSVSNAWDRRYNDELIGAISNSELSKKANDGSLVPGDLIGFYNPASAHNNDLDMKGEKVQYTHNMLYLGLNEKKEPIFSQQYGDKTLVIGEEYIKTKQLEAREQIRAKK